MGRRTEEVASVAYLATYIDSVATDDEEINNLKRSEAWLVMRLAR